MQFNQRLRRYLSIPLFSCALLTALFLLIANSATTVSAAGSTDWQQHHGNQPMTHTMPMTGTTPPMTDHSRHQGPAMGEGQGMMDKMPMQQAGMGEQMTTMGRRMQMMGMMMQMMGQMHGMMDHMQGMMGGDMPMMQGNMPMTHTMPMTMPMAMGEGKGMMDGGMMEMPMMDMEAMHGIMGQMMDQMMAEMHELHQMHQTMDMSGHMQHNTPMTATTGAVAADSPQTAQVGTVEIVVTAINLHETDADTLDFNVAFNSHTEAIAIDLAQSAKLLLGDSELTPTAWETDTPEGHHIKGILRFARTAELDLTNAAELSLVIGGLPADTEQTFTWAVNSH